MKKSLSVLLAAVMAMGLMAGCGGGTQSKPAAGGAPAAKADDGKKYTIVFATNSAADPKNPQNVGTFYFKKILEEKSKGRITVDVHNTASLGGAREIVEGVQLGTITAGDVENGPMDSFVQDCAVWNLPYLFTSLDEVHKIQASDIGKNIQKKFEGIGIKHLAFNDGGFRYFTNNAHPIEKAADFKGLKIRVMESPIYISMVESLGGSAVPIAFAELYTALQQGTVDGQENPLDLIYAQAYYEVQKYVSLSEHLYYPRQYIINMKFYNSLPQDLQKLVADCAVEACNHQNKYYADYTKQMLEELKKKGMTVCKFDKQSAINATKGIWPKYYKPIGGGDEAAGKKVVDRISGGEFRK